MKTREEIKQNTMNVKDELLKELSTIDYRNGMNIDTIKLNTDLGVKIIENVVKKLIIGGVSNRRELLIAYEIKMASCSDKQAERKVDSYLASKSN